MSTKTLDAVEYLESFDGPLTFGKLLQALRSTDEFTQTELAIKAKVSKGLICDIEKGRRDASIELAAKLAKIMGYAPEMFISILLQEQIRRAKLNFKVTLHKAA